MEQYTINKSFKGLVAGQQVSKNCLVNALNLPVTMSESDTIFFLVETGMVTISAPERLAKGVSVPGVESFLSTYSLIDKHDMLYACDIEGFPDATLEELSEMGYMPIYYGGKEGTPYLEIDGARFYAGDQVLQMVDIDESKVFIAGIKLTHDFFSEQPKSGIQYFADINGVIKYLSARIAAGHQFEAPTLPVNEKLFSVNDINALIQSIPSNNKYPLYNQLAFELIEAAMRSIAA